MKPGTVFSVVGMILMVMGILMVIPAIYGWSIGEEAWISIAFASGVTVISGGALRGICRPAPLTAKDSFGIVGLGWLAAGIFGALPFYLSDPGIGFINCIFESVSGITTTGATIFTQESAVHEKYFDLPFCILLWRSLIQWIGGLGVIMMVIVLLPFLERSGLQILRAEVTVISQKIRPKMRDTGMLLAAIYVFLTGAEILLLHVAGMSVFDAVCHGFTTLSTGGFSPRTTSIEAYGSIWIEIIVMFFMFAGGASFLAHFRCLRGEGPLSYFRSSEIRLYTLIIASFAAVSTIDRFAGGEEGLSIGEGIRQGLFTAISFVTTTGYTNSGYHSWPNLTLVLIVMLMFAGGCVGSTGGSIKMRRLLILGKVMLREMRMVLYPNRVLKIKMDGEVVDEPVVRKVTAFVLLWMILFLTMAAIMLCYRFDVATSLSGAASCLGNVGPALGDVYSDYASLDAPVKIVLLMGMLVGRLEIFSVLVLFSPTVWRRSEG